MCNMSDGSDNEDVNFAYNMSDGSDNEEDDFAYKLSDDSEDDFACNLSDDGDDEFTRNVLDGCDTKDAVVTTCELLVDSDKKDVDYARNLSDDNEDDFAYNLSDDSMEDDFAEDSDVMEVFAWSSPMVDSDSENIDITNDTGGESILSNDSDADLRTDISRCEQRFH